MLIGHGEKLPLRGLESKRLIRSDIHGVVPENLHVLANINRPEEYEAARDVLGKNNRED